VGLVLSGHASNLREFEASKDFVPFNAWYPSTVPPSWEQTIHIKFIGDVADKVRLGDIDRVVLRMPPRHGKTETMTIRAIVRDLLDHPEWNILVTGYNQNFANRLSRKIRGLAKQMGVRLKPGAQGVHEWETEAGGCVVARGVGNPPTGIGFQRIYIDDPVRDHKQAASTKLREKINDWYLTDVYQRLEPGGAIVITMTQWDPHDLSTVAVEAEPEAWEIIRMPAIAEEDDPIGRKKGEALWPARFGIEALNRIRKVMSSRSGPRMFDALFLCNAYNKDGTYIKREEIQIVPATRVPQNLRLIRAYDVALSAEQSADETVGTLGGFDSDGNLWIVDVQWWQREPDDTVDRMLKLMVEDATDWDCEEYAIERPLAGEVIMKLLRKKARAHTKKLHKVNVSKKKDIRMAAWSWLAQQGKLFFVKGDWNEPVIEEILAYRGLDTDKDNKIDSISVLVEAQAMSSGVNNASKQEPEPHSVEWFRRQSL
jgi:predicted phage terminase large subunit-like protein